MQVVVNGCFMMAWNTWFFHTEGLWKMPVRFVKAIEAHWSPPEWIDLSKTSLLTGKYLSINYNYVV